MNIFIKSILLGVVSIALSILLFIVGRSLPFPFAELILIIAVIVIIFLIIQLVSKKQFIYVNIILANMFVLYLTWALFVGTSFGATNYTGCIGKCGLTLLFIYAFYYVFLPLESIFLSYSSLKRKK